MSGPDELLLANDKLVERLLDNAACASQERQLLRDADDTETVLREAVRRNVAVPLIAANAALAARCVELQSALIEMEDGYRSRCNFCNGDIEACRSIENLPGACLAPAARALASQAEGEK